MEGSAANKRIQFWVGIVVSIGCLAAIFVFINPAEILAALKNTRYELWVLAALTLVLFLVLRAIRWRFMLNRGLEDDGNLPYSSVFHIQNIGYLLTNILPFRLGDFARAVLIGNVPPATISLGLSTMVVERIFDLLFIVILFPFTVAAVERLPSEINAAAMLTGVLAIIAVLVLAGAANKRPTAIRIAEVILNRISFLDTNTWLRRLDDLLHGLDVLTSFKSATTLIILTVIVWLPIIAGYYIGMRAVNLDTSLIEAAFVVCIAALSITAPSSPGQVGVYEAGITFAIAGVLGLPEGQAASFAFINHAVNYIVIGVLGVIGITRTGETFGSVIQSTRRLVR